MSNGQVVYNVGQYGEEHLARALGKFPPSFWKAWKEIISTAFVSPFFFFGLALYHIESCSWNVNLNTSYYLLQYVVYVVSDHERALV